MNSDESPRGMQYPSSRKPLPPKSQGYSPSSNYNYGNQSQHGNNHGNHGNQNFGNQQHQRRKPMPFKRDNHGSSGSTGGGASDKLIKQNDIIIRLLKEIRDRLPPPPASVVAESAETSETDIVEEGVAIVQEQEPAVAEPVAEQDVVEPEPEPEPEELGPPPPKAARRPNFSDEELDLQANGNR
jgi:hypothetical protein